ncbi:MAG: lysozyme inhibitor LprI family protein [Gemmatirosa sp.]
MAHRLPTLPVRALPPLLVALTLAAPRPADAQPRPPRVTAPAAAEPRLPADLRDVRLRSAEPRRPSEHRSPAHRPPPPGPRRVRPVLIVVDPYGGAFAQTWRASTDAAPAPRRAPRTKVIDVAAAADTTCREADDTRALVECLGTAVRREDARLAESEHRARAPLAQTRPEGSVAAFDRAAEAWRRYREEECRARTLAIGGGTAAAYEGLACQLRLARERRVLLDAGPDARPAGS